MHDDKETDFSEYVNNLSDISAEFDKKFQDFQLIQNNFQLIDLKILSNPFTAD